MSYQENALTFLEHFGIKGQKWGVRTKSRSGSKPAGDAKKAQRGKTATSLTNKQLKEANERISLEQQFKRLNPGKMESGRSKANEILATVGVGVAVYNLANSPAGKAAIAAGKKALSN